MSRESIEVQTNIPFTALLKYVDERTTAHGARLKLVLDVGSGQEDYPAGEREMWAPMSLLAKLHTVAAVDELSPNDKGRVFKVPGKPHLKIVRKEVKAEGEAKAHSEYRVERLDEYTPRTEAPAPVAASAAPPGNGHTRPTGGLDVSKVEERREAFKRWLALGEKYAAACFLADRALTTVLAQGVDDGATTAVEWGDLVQRGATTILIEGHGVAPGFPNLLAALEEHFSPPSKPGEVPPNAPEPERTTPPPPGDPADDDLPF